MVLTTAVEILWGLFLAASSRIRRFTFPSMEPPGIVSDPQLNSPRNLTVSNHSERKRKRKSQSPQSEATMPDAENVEQMQTDEAEAKQKTVNSTAHFSETKRHCRKMSAGATDDSASPILTLPNELLAQLVLYLQPKDIGRVACTCRRLCSLIGENFVWRSLCRSHFPAWNNQEPLEGADTGETSSSTAVKPYVGACWKRQYVLNSTKAIFYQNIGGSGRSKNINKIVDTPSAYGFRKMCCSRDHVFGLDFAGTLHVFRSRWERDPVSNEFTYKRATWHREFSKHVVDITTDPRYDNTHRRYVYVLSQSAAMVSKRTHPNTRSSNSESASGWNKSGVPASGDKIDVFDERSCRRVFNMTFDPEMRFTEMQLTSAESQQKTLFMLTDAGKVYSLHLFEPSLLNLGTEGIQVTLKSASKCLGEKVKSVKTSVGIVSFITVTGKLHVITQRPGEFYDLFGREQPAKLGVPLPIHHIPKVAQCSIGDRHMGFLDEYGRAFVLGNNRYGQLGTGDRMDRSTPTQVLCDKSIRILHCSLNHTLAVLESWQRCSVYGAGCGYNGRLPGRGRGTVEFVKLDIEIPWSTRQIDTHKECVFVLSCCDISEEEKFEKRRESSDRDTNTASLATQKTLQELLMDMKKAAILAEKVKVLEAMLEKVSKRQTKQAETSLDKFRQFGQLPGVAMDRLSRETEMDVLRRALQLLRHEAERVQLDINILKQK